MRVILLSIAFAPERILHLHYQQVYSTIGLRPDRHLVLNNHYPVAEDQVTKAARVIAKQYDAEFFDVGKNLGSAAGYNLLFQYAAPADDDIVILLDPDTNPVTPDWGKAMVDVHMAEKKVAWVSTTFPQVDKEFSERKHKEYEVAGYRVLEPTETMINSICSFKTKVVREIGGFYDATPWYGGFEAMMWNKIQGKYKWLFLKDYKEAADPRFESDPIYRQYKVELAHKRSTKLEFGAWLKQNNICTKAGK